MPVVQVVLLLWMRRETRPPGGMLAATDTPLPGRRLPTAEPASDSPQVGASLAFAGAAQPDAQDRKVPLPEPPRLPVSVKPDTATVPLL